MEKLEKWLKEGQQSKATPFIKETLKNLQDDGFEFILNCLTFLKKNLQFEPKGLTQRFRSRTAEQILKEKTIDGCSDITIAFVTLTRAKGIPTKYIEAPFKSWL